MRKSVLVLLVAAIVFGGFGECAGATCDYCSESNCNSYLVCEDFDVGGIPTNWHCDNHTDFNCDSCSEQDYWHDLGILGGHVDCSLWYGKVTADCGIGGTNCFESDVTSVADCQGYGGPNCTTAPACNGCHGGGFKARVTEDPLPNELWVRWYIYIPSTNYPSGDGPNYWHCNHHVFLSDGAGANPCINIRHLKHTPWTPSAGDSDGHLYISVGSNGIGESNTEGIADFVLDDHFDEWISIEWYLNENIKETSLWINGVKYVDNFSLSWTKPMDGFLFGQYNCANDDVGTTWKMYVDNVVVSTEGYIGPAESSVIFEEDFEDGTLGSSNPVGSGGDAHHISATTENARGSGSSWSAKVVYQLSDNLQHLICPLSSYDSGELYARFYYRYDEDFGFETGENHKLGRLIDNGTHPSSQMELQRFSSGGYKIQGQGAIVNEWFEGPLDTGWHKYELYLKYNSDSTTADGTVKAWIDDQLKVDRDGDAIIITVDPVSDYIFQDVYLPSNFAGNPDSSDTYQVDDIEIWDGMPNQNYPSRSNPQPTGTLASGTTSTNISLSTNVQATCRYTNTSGTNYTDMEYNFTSTNSTSHSTPVTGLENGETYIYHIRCNSSDGYVNNDDFNISFSIDGHKADTNDDGIINMPELMAFIARWKASDGVSRQEVLDARDIWFTGGVC